MCLYVLQEEGEKWPDMDVSTHSTFERSTENLYTLPYVSLAASAACAVICLYCLCVCVALQTAELAAIYLEAAINGSVNDAQDSGMNFSPRLGKVRFLFGCTDIWFSCWTETPVNEKFKLQRGPACLYF